jgi:hypothetical protein
MKNLSPLVFTPHSFLCFRVQVWAERLGSRLWDLGQICGLNELDRRSGQPVRYQSNWKVTYEFIHVPNTVFDFGITRGSVSYMSGTDSCIRFIHMPLPTLNTDGASALGASPYLHEPLNESENSQSLRRTIFCEHPTTNREIYACSICMRKTPSGAEGFSFIKLYHKFENR